VVDRKFRGTALTTSTAVSRPVGRTASQKVAFEGYAAFWEAVCRASTQPVDAAGAVCSGADRSPSVEDVVLLADGRRAIRSGLSELSSQQRRLLIHLPGRGRRGRRLPRAERR
jgi:hypothetical protein